MKLISFTAAGRSSYGVVVGDGIVDLGRRLGERYPTLRTAIAGGELGVWNRDLRSQELQLDQTVRAQLAAESFPCTTADGE